VIGVIFWVSSGPVPPVVPDQFLDVLVKKAGHFSAYALLAGLWWLALRGRVTPRVALVAAFVIAAGYAGSDEIHQAFSPTRHPSVVDVGIDALGALTGPWVIVRWVRRRQGPPRSGKASDSARAGRRVVGRRRRGPRHESGATTCASSPRKTPEDAT
jgi:VanZ family protein